MYWPQFSLAPENEEPRIAPLAGWLAGPTALDGSNLASYYPLQTHTRT